MAQPPDMIDIHSHVLCGLDDGAEDLEMSLRMLSVAAENGTTDIVATPHANGTFVYEPEVIKERICELERAMAGPVPRIHRGCDFHLSYENIEDALKNPHRYTVNEGHWLLVEFADAHIPGATAHIFDQLTQSDMFPIITHPERNGILVKRMDDVAQWVERGSFVQVTAKSLEGGFGGQAKDAAWELIHRGLVHFVASDAHDPEFRPPRLDRAFKLVESRMGREQAQLLFHANPAAVISGADPARVVAAQGRRKRSFFGWFG